MVFRVVLNRRISIIASMSSRWVWIRPFSFQCNWKKTDTTHFLIEQKPTSHLFVITVGVWFQGTKSYRGHAHISGWTNTRSGWRMSGDWQNSSDRTNQVSPVYINNRDTKEIYKKKLFCFHRPTFVHRFIVLNTIEETIFQTVSKDMDQKWKTTNVTVDNLREFFTQYRKIN